MLDSGASGHMVGNMSLLSETEKIRRMGIGLPNDAYTMASDKGTTTLGTELQF